MSRRSLLKSQGKKTVDDSPKPPMSAVLTHYDIEYMTGWSGWQSILCPFHNESRPSCSVNVDDGKFRCHSCGEAGDVWSFIMGMEGLKSPHDFPTAVRLAEEWTGGSYSKLRGAAALGQSSRGADPDVPFEQVDSPRHRRRVPNRGRR